MKALLFQISFIVSIIIHESLGNVHMDCPENFHFVHGACLNFLAVPTSYKIAEEICSKFDSTLLSSR